MLVLVLMLGILCTVHSDGNQKPEGSPPANNNQPAAGGSASRVEGIDKLVPIKRVPDTDLFTGIAYSIRFENPGSSKICGNVFGNVDNSFPFQLDAPHCKCPKGNKPHDCHNKINQFVIVDRGNGCYSIKGVGKNPSTAKCSQSAWGLGVGLNNKDTPILLELGKSNTSFKFERAWTKGSYFIQATYMNQTRWMSKKNSNEVTLMELKSEFAKTVWEPVSTYLEAHVVDIVYHEDPEIMAAQTKQKIVKRQTYVNNNGKDISHKMNFKVHFLESHFFRLPLAFNIIEKLGVQEGLPSLGSTTFPKLDAKRIGSIPNFSVETNYEHHFDEQTTVESKSRVTITVGMDLTKGVEVPATLMLKFSLKVARLVDVRSQCDEGYGCMEVKQESADMELVMHFLESNNISGRIVDVDGYSVIFEIEASVRATFVSHTFMDIEGQRLL